MYRGSTWLPYVYGSLRTVADQDPELRDSYDWLEPIFNQVETLQDFKDNYDPKDIDVLGISCYEWNHVINFEIAEYVKKHNSDCLVVAGGPQPSWRDDEIFVKHPFIDIVVKGDGEIPFNSILKNHLHNKPNDLVPGLIENDGGRCKRTAKEVPYKFDVGPSPYIHLADEFAEYVNGPEPSFATLETNKGCPYKCTFCDWGSATNQKIRKVGRDRVYDEIEWFGKYGIELVYITDANFGILPEDIKIAKALVETKEKYGFPKNVFYNLAKNNDDRIADILKMFNDAGMIGLTIMINFQSTLDEVLGAMERFNAPFPKIKNMVRRLIDYDIAPGSSLIQGAPLETVESWKKSVTDVYELGIHEETRIFIWQQLPNAPAMHPEYIEKYELKHVDRVPVMNRFDKSLLDKLGRLGLSSYLVESSTYTRDDWAEMGTFSAFTLMCHNFGLTRYIAMWERHANEVSYLEFYEKLYEKFKETDLYTKIKQHHLTFTSDSNALYNIEYNKKLPFLVDPEEYMFMKTTENLDAFYEMVGASEDITRFQRSMVVSLFGTEPWGRTVRCDHDWWSYFTDLKMSHYEDLKEPRKVITRMACDVDIYDDKLDNMNVYMSTVLRRKAGRKDLTILHPEHFRRI